jgi:hypothetical protein
MVHMLLMASGAVAASGERASESHKPLRLLVLDIELVGDLSDPALAREHEQRLERVSEQLRRELAQYTRYEIVDSMPASELIERLRGTQYLHKCNGCEIDIALELGADRVLVAWIHRVSQLILSLTYEIREVPSGQPLRRKAFDFRGDNDTGWSRAVTYMVKDLASAERK